MRDVMQHVESLFVMEKRKRKKVNEEEEESKGNEETLKDSCRTTAYMNLGPARRISR
jgi:hypothetical protein